jgi:hypothetical protein
MNILATLFLIAFEALKLFVSQFMIATGIAVVLGTSQLAIMLTLVSLVIHGIYLVWYTGFSLMLAANK